jgi:hypothetical protein
MAPDTKSGLTEEQCFNKANECRALAREARSESHRIMLGHIAETWERIAPTDEACHLPQICVGCPLSRHSIEDVGRSAKPR